MKISDFVRNIKFWKSGQSDETPPKLSDDELTKIYPRLNLNDEDQIVYHYCSPATFDIIIRNRTLRFSDIFAMNDFSEMHWGYSIFEKAASRLLTAIPKDFFDHIDTIITHTGLHILPLVCCFSLDGDVLSQWRAYGQDGTGYAIGFDAKMLRDLPVRPLRVLYDKEQQINEVLTWLSAVHDITKNDLTYKTDPKFVDFVAAHAIDLCALKNPGFREELEVRYVHGLNIDRRTKYPHLVSNGGTAWGKLIEKLPLQFRMKQSTPVAFIDMDYSNERMTNPIKKIVLGPKNDSRVTGIELYLNTMGLHDVEITRSETSYN